MCQEQISNAETNQIVNELVGADAIREEEICREHGIDRDAVYDVMTSRGYEWEEKWVKADQQTPEAI